jgi:hypothetical protein
MFINSFSTLPTNQNIASSWRVFKFLGGLIGLCIGIVFALIPYVFFTRIILELLLKQGSQN